MSSQLTTPVVFLIFNRPDTTFKVFETIRKAKPTKLLLVADGARFPEEKAKCNEARSIIEKVDWDCEILTNFSEINLGCKLRVSSGLDWVFTLVDEVIILEDDCLPDFSFFQFCEELLIRYRYDQRVMMISGDNFCVGDKRTSYSYYFSRYVNIWGWATWKRAWQYYDIEMKLWDEIKQGNWLQDILSRKRTLDYWHDIFQRVYDGEINTWDYQWVFTCWINGGYSIVPMNNLVSNIGFGSEATHTTKQSKSSNILTKSIQFPLRHPPFLIQDAIADLTLQTKYFDLRFLPGVRRKLKRNYMELLRKIQLFP
jgi:hypothetical protein